MELGYEHDWGWGQGGIVVLGSKLKGRIVLGCFVEFGAPAPLCASARGLSAIPPGARGSGGVALAGNSAADEFNRGFEAWGRGISGKGYTWGGRYRWRGRPMPGGELASGDVLRSLTVPPAHEGDVFLTADLGTRYDGGLRASFRGEAVWAGLHDWASAGAVGSRGRAVEARRLLEDCRRRGSACSCVAEADIAAGAIGSLGRGVDAVEDLGRFVDLCVAAGWSR